MTSSETNSAFKTLMKRGDIDNVVAKHKKMYTEILNELSSNISMLRHWSEFEPAARSGCGSDYPGIGSDGETHDFNDYTVNGKLSDSEYEQALKIIGQVGKKYGFASSPQRLHDSPGSHDAAFHNTENESEITFGTDKNTLIGVSVGCHLTVEAKKRGHPGK